jgi:hypothetical protein
MDKDAYIGFIISIRKAIGILFISGVIYQF